MRAVGLTSPRSICSAPVAGSAGLWLTSERPPGTCDPCCVALPGGLAPGLGSSSPSSLFGEGAAAQAGRIGPERAFSSLPNPTLQ